MAIVDVNIQVRKYGDGKDNWGDAFVHHYRVNNKSNGIWRFIHNLADQYGSRYVVRATFPDNPNEYFCTGKGNGIFGDVL